MSLFIILFLSCFTPERLAEGQVSIPHDEIVITFVAE